MGWEMSSLEKAFLIAIGLTLIAIGVLWTVALVSGSGDIRTISVDTDVKKDDKLVSVKESSTTIETQKLTIKAEKIEATMLSEQIAIVEFKVNKDFANALVLNDHGDIIETHEFVNKRTEIEFSGTKTSTIVILASGDDKYGCNQGRENFLDWCSRKTRGIDKARTIDFLIAKSVMDGGSNDFVGIVVVKTTIVQPEITDVIGEWDDDGDELEITGQSNLPRYTEIEWQIFGEAGVTKAGRNGKIDFDIDLDGIDTSGNCVLKLWVQSVNWFEEPKFNLGPRPDTEPVMSIKPKVAPAPLPRITPTPSPTLKITRVLADPPKQESVKESAEKAVEEVQRAEQESEQMSILETLRALEVKWLPEIITFLIAIIALLILRKKMKK